MGQARVAGPKAQGRPESKPITRVAARRIEALPPPFADSMRLSFFEWAARVVMLTLAGLVTLSLVGALAAISSQSGQRGLVDRQQQPPVQPAPQPENRQVSMQPPNTAGKSGPAAPVAGGGPAVASAPVDRERDRWLEAIAYALLALAGLMALGVVLLWRALGQWRRIADALEDRALSRPPR